jgi:hypothetical protein
VTPHGKFAAGTGSIPDEIGNLNDDQLSKELSQRESGRVDLGMRCKDHWYVGLAPP